MSKMKVVFATKEALASKTPEVASTIATVVLYVAAVGNIILASFPQIPASVKGDVGIYSAEAVGAVHLLCNLFGLKPAGPESGSPSNF